VQDVSNRSENNDIHLLSYEKEPIVIVLRYSLRTSKYQNILSKSLLRYQKFIKNIKQNDLN
jgi:hypothetical protein